MAAKAWRQAQLTGATIDAIMAIVGVVVQYSRHMAVGFVGMQAVQPGVEIPQQEQRERDDAGGP